MIYYKVEIFNFKQTKGTVLEVISNQNTIELKHDKNKNSVTFYLKLLHEKFQCFSCYYNNDLIKIEEEEYNSIINH